MALESKLSRRIRGPRGLVAVLPLLAILLAACESPTESGAEPDDVSSDPPPSIDFLLTTDDPADTIRVVSNRNTQWGDKVGICLTLSTESGWWKGLGINTSDPTLEVDDANRERCKAIFTGNTNFMFWKAKFLGAHTHVGEHSLDLTRYAGYTIRFDWRRD